MVLVIEKLKILKFVIKNRGGCAFDVQFWQRHGLAGELGLHLFEVVVVEVAVAACPDEFFCDEACLLRNHVG